MPRYRRDWQVLLRNKFVSAEDFVARCRLLNAEDLCKRIRLYVETASAAIANVALSNGSHQHHREHRMITRRRARDDEMRRMLECLDNAGTKGCYRVFPKYQTLAVARSITLLWFFFPSLFCVTLYICRENNKKRDLLICKSEDFIPLVA